MFYIKAKYYKQKDKSYSYKVFKTVEEINELRPIWEKMQNELNVEIDHYLTIIKVRNLQPFVILLYKNNVPENLLICRLENIYLEIKIGYKVLLKPGIKSLTILYGGVTGKDTGANAKALLFALKKSLKHEKADTIFIRRVKTATQFYKYALEMPDVWCRDHSPVPTLHWQIKMPDSYDSYYKSLSKSTRKNLQKKNNRLQRDFPGKLQFVKYSDKNDINTILQDVERIAQNTYHRGLNAGFKADYETEQRTRLLLSKKLFSTYIYYIDGKPAAFQNCNYFKNLVYLDNCGYDPFFYKYSIGNILLQKIFKDCFRYDNVTVIDYGLGDSSQKHSFCNHHWEEADVYIFSPSFKILCLNSIRTVTMLLQQFVIKLFRHSDILKKIKKYWRNVLSPDRT